jgi:hypothetical protein
MDEIQKRFARHLDASLMRQMTSNVPQPDPGPLTLSKLQTAMQLLAACRQAPPPVRIVESVHMVDQHEDWSKARSPSRTRRRMRYNAARILTYTPKKEAYQLPTGELVMHPTMAQEVRRRMKPL